MPSTAQHDDSDSSEEYLTDAHRFVDRKPKRMVLCIKPTTEANARDWLGAASTHGDEEMVEHFVDEVKRLR